MKKLLCKLFGHRPHRSYVIVNTFRRISPIPGMSVYWTFCTRCSRDVQVWQPHSQASGGTVDE